MNLARGRRAWQNSSSAFNNSLVKMQQTFNRLDRLELRLDLVNGLRCKAVAASRIRLHWRRVGHHEVTAHFLSLVVRRDEREGKMKNRLKEAR